MEKERVGKDTGHLTAGGPEKGHESDPAGNVAASALAMESGDLPEAYDETRVVLLPVSPWQVHAYWGIGQDVLQAEAARRGEGRSAKAVLRFHDVSDIPSRDKGELGTLDVHIDPDAESGYYQLCIPGRSYFVELGLLRENDEFVPLSRSNVVQMPFAEPVPKTAASHEPDEGKRGQVSPLRLAVGATPREEKLSPPRREERGSEPEPGEKPRPDPFGEDPEGSRVGVSPVSSVKEMVETPWEAPPIAEQMTERATGPKTEFTVEGENKIPQSLMSRAHLLKIDVIAPVNVLEKIRRKYVELHRLTGDIWRFLNLSEQVIAGPVAKSRPPSEEVVPPDLTELSEKRFVVGISSAPAARDAE